MEGRFSECPQVVVENFGTYNPSPLLTVPSEYG